MELKVGVKCKQIKVVEEYGFDYMGKEFEITKIDGNVVMCKGNGLVFGIERDKFDNYFEVVEKIKDKPKFGIKEIYDISLKNNDTYEKGDTLKITNGLFKDIEGTFIDYVKGYDKVLIQIDDMNRLYVDSTNVMLSKKKVNNTHEDEKYNDIVYDLDGFSHPVQVRFHNNHTYVKLNDGTKSRSSCYPSDEFNEEEGIKRAFYRTMIKRYNKALEDLNT